MLLALAHHEIFTVVSTRSEYPNVNKLDFPPSRRARLIGSSTPSRSQILSAINFNMFPVFMVANLATGAINLSMRTLDADTSKAVMILSIYLVVVAGFAVILMDRWGFKVKV